MASSKPVTHHGHSQVFRITSWKSSESPNREDTFYMPPQDALGSFVGWSQYDWNNITSLRDSNGKISYDAFISSVVSKPFKINSETNEAIIVEMFRE